jgi:hypothetical protein
MSDSDGDASGTSNEFQSDSDGEKSRRQRSTSKRRGRKPAGRRQIAGGSDDDDDDDNDDDGAGDAMDALTTKRVKVKRRIDYSKTGFAILNGKPILPSGCEIDRKWLQSTRFQPTRYCPQIGDRIVYICEGHKRYLMSFPSSDGKSTPWNSFASDWPLVTCQVTNISYTFPNASEYNLCRSVIASVELTLVSVPKRCGFDHDQSKFAVEFIPWPPKNTRQTARSASKTFEVVLRSCECPDFLVNYYISLNNLCSHIRLNIIYFAVTIFCFFRHTCK